MGQADISSKYLLAGEPEKWIRWLLEDATAQVEERLSAEFQFILRQSDELFRVRGQHGLFVLVVEVQLRVDPRMPRRVRAYAALAEEKYSLSVYPVVFYLLPPGAGAALPGSYHSEFMGLVAHQDFQVVPVWELQAREVLKKGITALVPFSPLMQGGAQEETLQASVRFLREREAGEEAEVALALFASFVMSPERVQQIVRWDMNVIRESPWYNQILQEGLQQARRQDIVRMLEMRFGSHSSDMGTVSERLLTIQDVELLQEMLMEAARTPSLEAFVMQLKAPVVA
jgi:predicted transposase YdaD